MNLHNATLRFALLTCIAVPGLTSCHAQQRTSANATTQQKIAALQGLRDSGVLSEEEYQQKVAALQGSNAGSHAPAHAVPGKGPGTPTVDHAVMDQAWGLPWGAIKLPAGWGFNGGVLHAGFKGCAAVGDSPMFVAESADKLWGLASLPMLKTNWTSDQQLAGFMHGCPMLRANTAAEYLTKFVLPHFHQNFRVVEIGKEPNFEQAAEQMRAQNAQFDQAGAGNQSFQARRNVDTARVLLTYDVDGHTVNEVASAMISCTDTVMRMPGLPGRPPQTDTLECIAYNTFIMHAPDDGTPFTVAAIEEGGKTKLPGFFKVIPSQAWQQRFSQAQQQASQQIAAEGQAQLQATQNANNGAANNQQSEFEKQQAARQSVSDYSRQVHNNVYQNRQAANSQVAGAYAAHMGDYNVYTNPNSGQQVQLSNQYNNTYVNSQGNVSLQTNSANSPGADWTQMVPKY